MSFPLVADRSITNEAVASTSHAITFPGTITVGEFLFVFLSATTPLSNLSLGSGSGWAFHAQNGNPGVANNCIAYKIADGTDTLNIASSTSVRCAYASFRITGADGIVDFNFLPDAGVPADPPPLTPALGVAIDYLWLALAMTGSAMGAVSAPPAGYSNLQTSVIGGGTNRISTAENAVNAHTEDPGAFTTVSSGNNGTWTVAITPAELVGEADELTPFEQYDFGTADFEASALGQTHNLSTVSLTVEASELAEPALQQIHGLSTSFVSSVPAISTPVLGQQHNLQSVNLTSDSPELGSPGLNAIVWNLEAVSISGGSPVLDQPMLGITVNLTAAGLTVGAPTLEQPILTATSHLNATNLATGVPVVGVPALAQLHNLAGISPAAGSPALGNPTIGQRHVLGAAEPAAGSPDLGTPAISTFWDFPDVTVGLLRVASADREVRWAEASREVRWAEAAREVRSADASAL